MRKNEIAKDIKMQIGFIPNEEIDRFQIWAKQNKFECIIMGSYMDGFRVSASRHVWEAWVWENRVSEG